MNCPKCKSKEVVKGEKDITNLEQNNFLYVINVN